ncbi:MAG TPA: septal ring lytic transglycosylase RlpA family protein [Candidatus Binataceae bacterium]|nr:septal ring lytic transglycosylase RlpA family protein [Candidatus Binataceae bacterium]
MVVIGTFLRSLALIVAGFVIEGCFTQHTLHSPPPPALPAGTSITGIASWYGPGFNGHRTSAGSIYNQDGLSAASMLFPLGSRLRVTNLSNGSSVEVVVNDHGPFVQGRDLDLSHRAAVLLGIIKPGTARVRMDVLGTPAGGPALGPRYFVQVGSFTDLANAQRLGAMLARYYDDVRIIEATSDANRYYRVRMGMFLDRTAAEQRALAVSRSGLSPVIITE